MDTTIGACLRTDKLRVFRDHFRAVEMPNMLLLRVLIWRLGREFTHDKGNAISKGSSRSGRRQRPQLQQPKILGLKMEKKVWQWQRTIDSRKFIVSSHHTPLFHSFVQEAFATEDMFWATPVSPAALETMLSESLSLGLYAFADDGVAKAIGMARLITDYTTFALLTDVYLQPAYRSLGLGKWIIHCCREVVLEMPHLRFMQLLAGSEKAQQLYRQELGMQKLDGREETLVCMGARKARLAEAEEMPPARMSLRQD